MVDTENVAELIQAFRDDLEAYGENLEAAQEAQTMLTNALRNLYGSLLDGQPRHPLAPTPLMFHGMQQREPDLVVTYDPEALMVRFGINLDTMRAKFLNATHGPAGSVERGINAVVTATISSLEHRLKQSND